MPAGLVSATMGLPPASSRAVAGGSIPEPGRASAVAVLGLQMPPRASAPASGHQSTSMGRQVPKITQGLAKATMPAFTPHTSRPHFG
jgi:hypothetical protein